MTYQFIFPGEIPSKKNSRILVCFGRRPVSLPGKTYKNWHKSMEGVSKFFTKPKEAIDYPISAEITIYPRTKRRFDISNKIESIMDFLVDIEVLKDDNFNIVKSITGHFGGIDIENPRAVVIIK